MQFARQVITLQHFSMWPGGFANFPNALHGNVVFVDSDDEISRDAPHRSAIFEDIKMIGDANPLWILLESIPSVSP